MHICPILIISATWLSTEFIFQELKTYSRDVLLIHRLYYLRNAIQKCSVNSHGSHLFKCNPPKMPDNVGSTGATKQMENIFSCTKKWHGGASATEHNIEQGRHCCQQPQGTPTIQALNNKISITIVCLIQNIWESLYFQILINSSGCEEQKLFGIWVEDATRSKTINTQGNNELL